MAATRNLVRKQVRGFVVAWSMVTVLVATLTFFAVYLTYDGTTGSVPGIQNIALPTNTPPQNNAAVANPPTLVARATTITRPTIAPTTEPEVEDEPTDVEDENEGDEEGNAEAQSAETNTPIPEPTLTPTVIPVEDESFQVGIQVQHSLDLNPDNQDIWMNDVANKLGLDWTKVQVRWENIEATKGEFKWAEVGIAVNSAKRYGLKTMVSVVTAPEWAREEGVDTSKHGPPANPEDYVNFVSELVKRFDGRIHAIEVWNEQNLDREWMSNNGLNAGDYVDLLRQTYQAIKEIDPGIIVISGALSPGGGWQENDGRISAIDDFSYLDGMIEAGFLDYVDCVGVHHNGYNIGPSVPWDSVEDDPTAEFRGPFDNPHHSWSFYSTLQTYANKVQVAGYDTKLCITEFGWASTEDLGDYPDGFSFALDNTLEEQSEWTVEALNNMEEWEFVWLAFIWNFNYGPQAGWDPKNDNVPYSIIGPDWVHRPVYDAIVEWAQERQ